MTIAFFDTKPYDRLFFDAFSPEYGVEIRYFEHHLEPSTVSLAAGADAAVCFVNDTVDAAVISSLNELGVRVVALRCAGYNNVDLKAAEGRIAVLRVPAYSPHAVAEHAMGLLLSLNRHLHHAYNRTRDYNFSLNRMMGFDLYGKTAGIVGTGRIGSVFADICKGFGMEILAYDKFQTLKNVRYTDLDELLKASDILSLHCPLTPDTYHMIGRGALKKMKKDALIINTSRGALIDSEALLDALLSRRIGGAGLDVYEEENDLFYEDLSATIISDETLMSLLALPNVLITSHQGFLTKEAMENIAKTTLENLKEFFEGGRCDNQIRLAEAVLQG